MNLINKNLIDLVISSAETYRNEVYRALEQYGKERDVQRRIAEKYKDEDTYFAQQQEKLAEIAKADIAKAQRIFSTRVNELASQMEIELKKHISEPVNPKFREKLSMLADFGIQPELFELEDLLALNAQNQLGLTALAKTLKLVESPFSLKYRTTAQYQEDLALIRGLTKNLMYAPHSLHQEACEIYKGATADYEYPDGSVLKSGITYNSVTLIAGTAEFEGKIATIEGFKDSWCADVTYDECKRIAEELPASEIKEPESEIGIEDRTVTLEGVKRAKELGEIEAKARQVYDEYMK